MRKKKFIGPSGQMTKPSPKPKPVVIPTGRAPRAKEGEEV